MNELKEQGSLFVYIKGFLDEEKNEISIMQVNNLTSPNNAFFNNIKNIKLDFNNNEENTIEIYSIIGIDEKIDMIKKEIDGNMKSYDYKKFNNYDIVSISSIISFLLKNNLKEEKNIYITTTKKQNYSILSLCLSNKPWELVKDYFDSTLNIWVDGENPMLYGKQVITYNYLLNDLRGRRIVSSIKDTQKNERYLILEGGLKLNLETPYGYQRQSLELNDIGFITPKNIYEVLINPCYALGKCYYPLEIFYLWQQALLYVISTSDVKWNVNNLEHAYNKFLLFLESEICDAIPVEAIISKEQFYEVFLINIKETRKHLKGNYESIISKDYILFLRSCLPFIRPIKILLKKDLGENLRHEFDSNKYKSLINRINIGNNYEKGIGLERVAEYLFDTTTSFKVMAKRERTTREEIDLSCCNISYDYDLWNMGAYLNVECKNWNKKVGIKTIRELGYIMFYKGNTSTILIVKKGITKKAQEEIQKLALQEKYVLTFDLEELKRIDSAFSFVTSLKNKFNELISLVENDISLIGE